MKKKFEIKMVCEKCGLEPEPNKKKSNENWVVVDNKPCRSCGGKLTIKIK